MGSLSLGVQSPPESINKNFGNAINKLNVFSIQASYPFHKQFSRTFQGLSLFLPGLQNSHSPLKLSLPDLNIISPYCLYISCFFFQEFLVLESVAGKFQDLQVFQDAYEPCNYTRANQDDSKGVAIFTIICRLQMVLTAKVLLPSIYLPLV